MSKTSEVEIVKSMKLLVAQSENLKKQSEIALEQHNNLIACQAQGKSAGIGHAINILKPEIEFMRSEIRLKKKVIVFLFVVFVVSVFFNFMQYHENKILQDFNDEILNEEVDYNSFQD